MQVYENGRLVDNLMTSALTHHDVSQYEGPPCHDQPCLNGGVCVAELNDYKCRCARGFAGDKCEEGECLC